jgi:outer membrane protein TolC
MTGLLRILSLLPLCAGLAFAQTAPPSPNHPWHTSDEQTIETDAQRLRESRLTIDPNTTYTLAELIDLAETQNPGTRVAWERARTQAAALGIARSELYPALAAAVLSQTQRSEILFGDRFIRQTVQDFDVALSLNYTVFDFGARSARISATRAQVLAANFAFNDTHRRDRKSVV